MRRSGRYRAVPAQRRAGSGRPLVQALGFTSERRRASSTAERSGLTFGRFDSYGVVVWRMDFFNDMAQIGPWILVAFVLEERLGHEGGNRLWFRGVGLLWTLLAEVITLSVVNGVNAPRRSTGEQVGGLMMLGTSYLANALGGASLLREGASDEKRRRALRGTYTLSAVFMVGGFALIVDSWL